MTVFLFALAPVTQLRRVNPPRFRTWLLAGLAVVQRTRVFGICLAIGAAPSHVKRVVLANAARTLGAGIALGLLASAALTRSMSRLLYGVTPLDAVTFLTVPLVLITVGLLASYIPARRASRIDPMLR